MKMEKGHRYKPAHGVRVQEFDPKAKAWTDVATDFECAGTPAAVAGIDGYGRGGPATPIKPVGSKTIRYLDQADVADGAKWDIPDRPPRGTSQVDHPTEIGKHDHVSAYVTPWDVNGKQDGARMVGFSDPRLGWRTDVQWGPLVPGYAQPEGSWMKAARLGPDHPRGGDTDENTRTNSKQIAKDLQMGASTWIAGHLLNDWLGGSGHEPKNLVAIPQPANAQMSSFEEKVKAEVNTHGNWVTYSVETQHDPASRVVDKIDMSYQLLDTAGAPTGDKHQRTITVPHLTESKKGANDDVKSRMLSGEALDWAADAPEPGNPIVNPQQSQIYQASPTARPLVSEREVGPRPTEFPYDPSREPQQISDFVDSHITDQKVFFRTFSMASELNADQWSLPENKRNQGQFNPTELPAPKSKSKAKKSKTKQRKEVIQDMRSSATSKIKGKQATSDTNQVYEGWYLRQVLDGNDRASKKQRATPLDPTQRARVESEPNLALYDTVVKEENHNDVGRAAALDAFTRAGHKSGDFEAVWDAYNTFAGRLGKDFGAFLADEYVTILASGKTALAWLTEKLMV